MNRRSQNILLTFFLALVIVGLGVAAVVVIPRLTTTEESIAPTAPESRPRADDPKGVESTQKQVNSGAEYVRNSSAGVVGLSGTPELKADGTTAYSFLSNVEYKAMSSNHIVRQDIWFNRLGVDAAKPRGILRWASTSEAVVAASAKPRGTPIQCTCGNNNLCLPAQGYAVIDDMDGAGSDFITKLTACTSWFNATQSTSYSDGSANHVVIWTIAIAPKWGPQGPNKLNDIAMLSRSVAGLENGWYNQADKFDVLFSEPLPQCKDGEDNDTDGKIDCVTGNADPGCFPDGRGGGGACNPEDTTELDAALPECGDGIDNDTDGKIDCVAGNEDPGCFPDSHGGGGACSTQDNSERNSLLVWGGTCSADFEVSVKKQCADGVDNDADGKIDCVAGNEDPGCFPDGRGGGGACSAADDDETNTAAPTATPTQRPTSTPRPTPTPTVAGLPDVTALPTATPTPVPELPDAGISLPTLGAISGGVIMVLLGILLAL